MPGHATPHIPCWLITSQRASAGRHEHGPPAVERQSVPSGQVPTHISVSFMPQPRRHSHVPVAVHPSGTGEA